MQEKCRPQLYRTINTPAVITVAGHPQTLHGSAVPSQCVTVTVPSALRPGAEHLIIEDAKTNARYRCAEDHQDLEVVPSKNLQIENPQAKEAHARSDQNKEQFSHASVPCMSPLRAAYAITTVSKRWHRRHTTALAFWKRKAPRPLRCCTYGRCPLWGRFTAVV